jgi:hydroxymethylpyrimidine/phosphomethylpyrimidine kinase
MDRGHAAGVNPKLPIALTIAGSDSGGGAGIQADLKTFAALGVHGASVIAALTAQNTLGVRAIHYPPPAIVAAQIEAVLADFAVAAIKIGMLGTAEIVGAVMGTLRALTSLLAGEGRAPFIVYDPVMIASSGEALSGAGFVDAGRRDLLPLVDCLTPNLAEAAALLDEPIARSEADMARQGVALLKLGPRAVLMKGGHLESEEAVDLLATAQSMRRYAAPRVASRNLHGTGCTLSSAIAVNVVLGMALPEAVAAAKAFVVEAIERGRGVTLGGGNGPVIQAKLRRGERREK